jgi:hypothetical protein
MKNQIKRSQHIISGLNGTGFNSKKVLLSTVATRPRETLLDFKRVKNCYRYPIFESWLENNALESLYVYSSDANKLLIDELKIIGLHVDLNDVLYHYAIKRDKNTLAELTKGKNGRKKTPLDLIAKITAILPNFENSLERARRRCKEKYTPIVISVRPCSMLLMLNLRNWHDTDESGNLGSSCMFSPTNSEQLSERAIKFYRRSGVQCAIAKQGSNVIARCFFDKNNNFTRIYSNSSISNNAIESAYKLAGFTKNNTSYNGFGYAKLNKCEDAIFVPYLDGNDKRIDIIDNDFTAKNGRRFIKFKFNGSEIDLKTTNGEISLTGCICSSCGYHIVDDEDANYLYNGERACNDCSSYCEECCETVLSDDMTTFFYRDTTHSINEGYCCESCADNMNQVPFRG